LYFLDDIQTAVHDELIHMSSLLCESRNAISALFRSAEFIFEQRVILCADYSEIVRHLCGLKRVVELVVVVGEAAVIGAVDPCSDFLELRRTSFASTSIRQHDVWSF